MALRYGPTHAQPFESLLTLGSRRSVSLFACVDGFCDVFFPLSHRESSFTLRKESARSDGGYLLQVSLTI